MDIWWSWVRGSEGVSQERSESGLGECPGGAAVPRCERLGGRGRSRGGRTAPGARPGRRQPPS